VNSSNAGFYGDVTNSQDLSVNSLQDGPEDEQRVGSSINEKRPLMEIGSSA